MTWRVRHTSIRAANVKKWQKFEQLVAAIHAHLNAADYDVETDVTLTERDGATHQVDVVLRPKTPFSGPILVSCKAWNVPVGVSHIREWADIVQQTGAAAGVVVAQSGFTADAINVARNPARRISLWVPRALLSADFNPDARSSTGYIEGVAITGFLWEPRLVKDTFNLDAVRADGIRGKTEHRFVFSASTHNQWYLRDEQDAIVGNLWDQFVSRAVSVEHSSAIQIEPSSPLFLIFDGVRFRVNRLTCKIEVVEHKFDISVDLLKDALGYENVIDKQLRIIPLQGLGRLVRMDRGLVDD